MDLFSWPGGCQSLTRGGGGDTDALLVRTLSPVSIRTVGDSH